MKSNNSFFVYKLEKQQLLFNTDLFLLAYKDDLL